MNNENLKNNLWKVGIVVGSLLALFLLVISVKEFKSISYVGKDTPAMNVISVNGKGEVISIPDIATFSFSVTENAKLVDEAQQKAADKINATLKAIKENGVNENDIKTLSYSINPHYEYQTTVCPVYDNSVRVSYVSIPCTPSKSVLTGYDVSQTVQVKIRDLKKAGALFETVGSLGVQNVNGLNFAIDDIDIVKAQARDIAIKNAKEKAKIIAGELGVRLVRITNFYDQSDEPSYYGREGMGSDVALFKGASAAPEIPQGEQKVTSTVSITYEIR